MSGHRHRTGIDGTPARAEAWTLDALGNWAALEQEEGGQSVLSQTREHNEANETGNISGWGNVAHDAAGNMSSMPRPGSWASATWACQYDAWNRLAQVLDISMGINTVARYEYDGLNRRVVKNVFDGGSLDHRLHFYYNESWQVLEVRREEDSTESEDPVEQFVWHPYYIDALATRFWDAAADGMAIEQHYFTHDANFNVTAALDDSGDVVERYHYSPYGDVTSLDDVFDPLAESAIDHWHLYTGRERDAETGLQLNRNRYYHPSLGRWVSRDPLGYTAGEQDLYHYVRSSPLSRSDPVGLISYQTVDCTETSRDCEGKYCDFECKCPRGYTSTFGSTHTINHRPCDNAPTLTCFRPDRWDLVCSSVAAIAAWCARCSRAVTSSAPSCSFPCPTILIVPPEFWCPGYPGGA